VRARACVCDIFTQNLNGTQKDEDIYACVRARARACMYVCMYVRTHASPPKPRYRLLIYLVQKDYAKSLPANLISVSLFNVKAIWNLIAYFKVQ